MNSSDAHMIASIILELAIAVNASPKEILTALEGVAWDEEDAGAIARELLK